MGTACGALGELCVLPAGPEVQLSLAAAATPSLVLSLSCKPMEVLELPAYVAVLFHSQKELKPFYFGVSVACSVASDPQPHKE